MGSALVRGLTSVWGGEKGGGFDPPNPFLATSLVGLHSALLSGLRRFLYTHGKVVV